MVTCVGANIYEQESEGCCCWVQGEKGRENEYDIDDPFIHPSHYAMVGKTYVPDWL
jgi:hypothetical protein